MTQSAKNAAIGHPCIVSVAGLKKSGKTTVVEALLSGLKSRGKRVSSIKKMEHAPSLDSEGTDTRRHADAGADVVVALLGAETVRFERVSAPASMRLIIPLFPADTDFLVSEGIADRAWPQLVVVCLRSADDWEETLKVRKISPDAVLAVSGVAAAGLATGAAVLAAGIRIFDVADLQQRGALVDLIIEKACPDVES
jgi:molybdopterin-guanine dinucleotide biosynthesis protein MobB